MNTYKPSVVQDFCKPFIIKIYQTDTGSIFSMGSVLVLFPPSIMIPYRHSRNPVHSLLIRPARLAAL